MFDIPRIVIGLILSVLIGWLAYQRRSLTSGGWLGAILTGTLTCGFGGWAWGLTLIAFFVTSSALSHVRQAQKQQIVGEKFEKGGRRDLFQALANGGAGALLALLFGLGGPSAALLSAFAGVIATVTADTWATELGVLSPHPPRLITSGRIVAPGTSGGVTRFGVLTSMLGALVIGLVLVAFTAIERGVWLPWLPVAALLGGLVGSLSDSLFGATVQAIYRSPGGEETERRYGSDGTRNQLVRGWRWMNNDLVNVFSSLLGGIVALGVYTLWQALSGA